jgi:hypothetical protein
MTPYDIVESEVLAASSLEESATSLEHLISGGFAVWDDGSLYSIKQLVGRANGLKIEIFAREHPPPHFHVSGGDIDATFSLVDGSQLEGKVSGRDRALVGWWYSRSRSLLVRTWNQTRPENCPVGPIAE